MNRFAHLLRLISSPPVHGYEHPEVVENIFHKTITYRPAGTWRDIRGAKSVLDFGGGCGVHYRSAVLEEPHIRWAVVETPAMVGKASALATDRLRFFTEIGAARTWLGSIDLVHSDAAIQYTQKPTNTIRDLCAIGAERMLWRRVFLSDDPATHSQRSLFAENGPGFRFTRKTMTVQCSSIREADFLHLHQSYRLIERGHDWFSFSREP